MNKDIYTLNQRPWIEYLEIDEETGETKIYLAERDGSCNYANDLRRKYPELLGLVDISKIFIKIVN